MTEAFSRASVQSSFSIENQEDDEFVDSTPLQTKILQVVKSCPDYTIRPAMLSHELGISITDASVELCGLLASVGEGSTFYFEDVGYDKNQLPQGMQTKSVKTMVFQVWRDNDNSRMYFLVSFFFYYCAM